MIKGSLLGIVMVLALATEATARHCPVDIAAINAALRSPSLASKLTAEKSARVKKLRDDGEDLHSAGQHNAAADTLAVAMRIILNALGR